MRVYFAGDTALYPGMAGLAGHVDVALLPVGRWGPPRGPAPAEPVDRGRCRGAGRREPRDPDPLGHASTSRASRPVDGAGARSMPAMRSRPRRPVGRRSWMFASCDPESGAGSRSSGRRDARLRSLPFARGTPAAGPPMYTVYRLERAPDLLTRSYVQHAPGGRRLGARPPEAAREAIAAVLDPAEAVEFVAPAVGSSLRPDSASAHRRPRWGKFPSQERCPPIRTRSRVIDPGRTEFDVAS